MVPFLMIDWKWSFLKEALVTFSVVEKVLCRGEDVLLLFFKSRDKSPSGRNLACFFSPFPLQANSSLTDKILVFFKKKKNCLCWYYLDVSTLNAPQSRPKQTNTCQNKLRDCGFWSVLVWDQITTFPAQSCLFTVQIFYTKKTDKLTKNVFLVSLVSPLSNLFL